MSIRILFSSLVVSLILCSSVFAVPQQINYQGILTDASENPVPDGSYSLTFRIYELAAGGTELWSETQSVTTADGRFTVFLGSLNPIPDSAVSDSITYLGVQVESDPEISPRAALVSVPYAYRVSSLEGAKGGTIDGTVYISAAPNDSIGNAVIVTDSSGNEGLAISIVNSIPFIDFYDPVDSKDNFALTTPGRIRLSSNGLIILDTNNTDTLVTVRAVANAAIIEFYDPVDSKDGFAAATRKFEIDKDGIRLFGATTSDTVFQLTQQGDLTSTGTVDIGTIATGGGIASVELGVNNTASGDSSAVTGGTGNTASGLRSFVGGGSGNTASDTGTVVVGGGSNSAGSNGDFIGGGSLNVTSSSDRFNTIVGGAFNDITGSAGVAFIGAGFENEASQDFASIVGGGYNVASGQSSFIGGGGATSVLGASDGNLASGLLSVVTGGQRNTASNQYAVVSGGQDNTASQHYAVVPGGQANTASGYNSYAAGENANATDSSSWVWSDGTAATSSTGPRTVTLRATGGYTLYSNSASTAGVTLAAGGSAWAAVSDSTLKRNVREVDYDEILRKVAELPVSQWSYEAQDPDIEHIGPMAQDFHRLFGVGDDETRITTLDPDGVALAAIRALYEKSKEVDDLKAEVEELRLLIHELSGE